ncbi:MAG TPA: sirohydrochlorin chelatase [Candidatus Sulfotelmatobacter sp.]|nr:sirohydrochlorin chelatase [Candidatus Sulfotelmatobacter sp.]
MSATAAEPALRRTGILMCGHGSRDVDAIGEFEHMTRAIRARLTDYDVDHAYLEFARPVIRDGLEALKRRGAARILALPGMLFAAGHVKNDIPWELNSFAADNPGIAVEYGRDLAIDPWLLRAAADRIEAALGAHDETEAIERADTLLLVVGRGTSDPDANSNIAKVARMLWEGLGFGWAESGFSGVAFPRVTQALERSVKLGFRRIVVFPYFLFTGVLVKRIYGETDAVAARHPAIDFVKADYLNDHPLVLDSFVARVAEIDRGENAMNCRLCKYRERLIGYEADAGAAQAGHHHHVRGIGTDADHHDHEHGHDHGHDHAHHDHAHGHRRPGNGHRHD